MLVTDQKKEEKANFLVFVEVLPTRNDFKNFSARLFQSVKFNFTIIINFRFIKY